MTASLFVSVTVRAGRDIDVDRDQTHYLSGVLRLSPGDTVVLLDGAGGRWRARIDQLQRHRARLAVIDRLTGQAESPLDLVLGQALLKGVKMDWVVQKATELGVRGIVPLITERSQPRRQDRTVRWRRIARAAAAQCGRTTVPDIPPPSPLLEFIDTRPATGILFWEDSTTTLAEILDDPATTAGESVGVLVGPEGGLTVDEVRAARKAGWHDASLGPRVLRAETGALTAVGLIQFLAGDLARPRGVSPDPPGASPRPHGPDR